MACANMKVKTAIHIFDSPGCNKLNRALADAILALSTQDFDKRSHFFHGRYENLYIEPGSLPGLRQIIETGQAKAAELLHLPMSDLRPGFWLNIMNKGDVTTLHSHDDDDELLSAVYYVRVPEDSAVFKLQHDGQVQEIVPLAGRFMFFDPALPHEVSTHNSDVPRISIGINFGRSG